MGGVSSVAAHGGNLIVRDTHFTRDQGETTILFKSSGSGSGVSDRFLVGSFVMLYRVLLFIRCFCQGILCEGLITCFVE